MKLKLAITILLMRKNSQIRYVWSSRLTGRDQSTQCDIDSSSSGQTVEGPYSIFASIHDKHAEDFSSGNVTVEIGTIKQSGFSDDLNDNISASEGEYAVDNSVLFIVQNDYDNHMQSRSTSHVPVFKVPDDELVGHPARVPTRVVDP